MNFAERVPSNEWAPLERTGEDPAEAWFKPNGEPFAVVFRVPQSRFHIEDLSQQLTLEDLLTAAAIATAEVESWQLGDETHFGLAGTNPELQRLLPLPSPDAPHLTIPVRLKPPTERVDLDVTPELWQSLDSRWKAILVVEAGIDSLRQSVEGLRMEMESEFRRSLGVEEKVHALQSDVAQWNKAKSRVHYTLPKAREFIHRATWASSLAERKRLEELFRTCIEPRIPFPQMDEERERMEHLQKDRQVLSALGSAVYQECRAVLSDIQRALSTLQRNAVERARKKRSAGREKGKHF